MAKLIDQSFVRQEFESGDLREELFPMLTKPGVPDYSETIHSYGLNYITAIGREIEGITAVSECPIYAPNSSLPEVRPDSVWFDLDNNRPLLVAEFERYNNSHKKQKKLKEKLQNLLIAYHQFEEKLECILFVYWSYAGITANKINDLVKVFEEGFTLPNGEYLSGINSFHTDYMIYHAIATEKKKNIRLNKWIKVS
ncbi:hypothetical protein MWH25_10980 [Natroniella acetigena]|uniref:hypothetical protein n=1 Tax=Natroniella acetigena TaxID=52004 RepID=UPI00200B4419|nr:hypothetical protein [Natroniella acetigena]MCK8828256.1 hypothetical protein [Natroniella acetigena]